MIDFHEVIMSDNIEILTQAINERYEYRKTVKDRLYRELLTDAICELEEKRRELKFE